MRNGIIKVLRGRYGYSTRGYLHIRRPGGGLDLISSLDAKFGASSGQVHQIRGKTWEILLPQKTKVGKNPTFGVKSKIQMAKFGVFVTYIFGGKIWVPNKNFRGKFWGQAPHLLIWKYPLWGTVLITHNFKMIHFSHCRAVSSRFEK